MRTTALVEVRCHTSERHLDIIRHFNSFERVQRTPGVSRP